MEPLEITKQLFQNHEIHIYGDINEPLFIANEIGKILDIKNIRSSIIDFEDYERKEIDIKYINGGIQKTTMLTEAGLYSLIFKSRKPIAKEFKKWVQTIVLPSLRKTGTYTINPLQIVELKLPSIEYFDVDINHFENISCVYLIHLGEDLFKYGISNKMINRWNTHFNKFTAMNLLQCSSSIIAERTELRIKRLAIQNNITATLDKYKEIIKTNNISFVIDKITEYINEANSEDKICMELRKSKIEIKKDKISNKKLELSNRNLELQIELLKLQTNNQTISQLPDFNKLSPVIHDEIKTIPILDQVKNSSQHLDQNVKSTTTLNEVKDISKLEEPITNEIPISRRKKEKVLKTIANDWNQ